MVDVPKSAVRNMGERMKTGKTRQKEQRKIIREYWYYWLNPVYFFTSFFGNTLEVMLKCTVLHIAFVVKIFIWICVC